MLLDQLLEYNKDVADNFLMNRLGKGFAIKGTGHYAKVYSTKNSEMVLKVFYDDPGYVNFLKMVIANHSNPSFPKIEKLFKVPSGKYEGLWMVKSEILQKITVPEFYHNSGFFCYLYEISKDETPWRWNILDDHVYYSNEMLMMTAGGDYSSAHPVTTENIEQYAHEWAASNTNLANALKLVIDNLKIFTLDLFADNVMKRPNGEWVITDPYSK